MFSFSRKVRRSRERKDQWNPSVFVKDKLILLWQRLKNIVENWTTIYMNRHLKTANDYQSQINEAKQGLASYNRDELLRVLAEGSGSRKVAARQLLLEKLDC